MVEIWWCNTVALCMALTWFPICKGARVCLLSWSRFGGAGLLLHWSQWRPIAVRSCFQLGYIKVMQYIGKGQTVHTLHSLISLELLEQKEDQYYCFLYNKGALLLFYVFWTYFKPAAIQVKTSANLPLSHIGFYTTSWVLLNVKKNKVQQHRLVDKKKQFKNATAFVKSCWSLCSAWKNKKIQILPPFLCRWY